MNTIKRRSFLALTATAPVSGVPTAKAQPDKFAFPRDWLTVFINGQRVPDVHRVVGPVKMYQGGKLIAIGTARLSCPIKTKS